MRRPHEGHVPSGGIEFGFQNLEHSSHQGIDSVPLPDSHLDRCRTHVECFAQRTFEVAKI